MSALIGTVSPGCEFWVLLLPLETEGAGLVLAQGDHACFDFISDCFRGGGLLCLGGPIHLHKLYQFLPQNDEHFDTHTTVHNL